MQLNFGDKKTIITVGRKFCFVSVAIELMAVLLGNLISVKDQIAGIGFMMVGFVIVGWPILRYRIIIDNDRLIYFSLLSRNEIFISDIAGYSIYYGGDPNNSQNPTVGLQLFSYKSKYAAMTINMMVFSSKDINDLIGYLCGEIIETVVQGDKMMTY